MSNVRFHSLSFDTDGRSNDGSMHAGMYRGRHARSLTAEEEELLLLFPFVRLQVAAPPSPPVGKLSSRTTTERKTGGTIPGASFLHIVAKLESKTSPSQVVQSTGSHVPVYSFSVVQSAVLSSSFFLPSVRSDYATCTYWSHARCGWLVYI